MTPRPEYPRPEYPRPILVREQWLNLNGHWQFQPDPEDIGLGAGWFRKPALTDEIIVPFPIESEASGIHTTEPARVNWYAREFEIPDHWQEVVKLNIGACDHEARIFINGLEVTQHRGGYTPIETCIRHALIPGINQIVIRVADDIGWTQVRGKQAGTTRWPIDYDTVTGIWQTVWLEPVPRDYITSLSSRFKLDDSMLTLVIETNQQTNDSVTVRLTYLGKEVLTETTRIDHRSEVKVALQVPDAKLWSPAQPALYDLEVSLGSGDLIKSYVGLREVGHNGDAVTLNGAPLYLRGILDQGYFEQGWYTPMSDEAIRRDVELTLAMGFNLTRKHQKIEDPRFLYWADQLGLMVWEEMPSGRIFSNELIRDLNQQWSEVLRRDRQHPCIIAWVPFNESWGVWHQASRPEQRALVDAMVALTRSYDSSRLVIGNDGWEYSSGDLWTLHLYEEAGRSLAARLTELIARPDSIITGEGSDGRVGSLPGAVVANLPILLTECGGVGFVPGSQTGSEFAYGKLPTSMAELKQKFIETAQTVNSITQIKGFVWTQLTDVQQEINGVLYFDRSPKFPVEEIRKIIESIGEQTS